MEQLLAESVKIFNDCNPNELDIIISRFYPYAFDNVQDKCIKYMISPDNITNVLVIFFYKSGNVEKVDCNNESYLNMILDAIKTDVATPVTNNYHCLVFTSENLEKTFFRLKNLVLLRPIEIADKDFTLINRDKNVGFPNILEFSFYGSDNVFINEARKIRKKAEIISLLNVLFKFNITDESGFHKIMYGISADDLYNNGNRNYNTVFRSGYILTSHPVTIFKQDVSEFDDTILKQELKLTEIEKLDTASYLSKSSNWPHICIPIYSQVILEKYFRNDTKNSYFVKACYWFSRADTFQNKGISGSIISLASALECLTDKSSKTCDVCTSKIFNIKSKVKDLIAEYCSGIIKKDNEAITVIGNFYDIRSQIIHGSSLPIEIPNQRSFDPTINKIRHKLDYYKFIVRCTIINWYMDKQFDSEINEIVRAEWSEPPRFQARMFSNSYKLPF